MNLSKMLRAAALSLPLVMAGAPAGASIGSNLHKEPDCDLSAGRFYTPQEIVAMNDVMGRMNTWLKSKHTTEESIIQHYIANTQDSTESRQDAIFDLHMVLLYDTKYKAGTVEGALWLAQSPERPVQAYGAYMLHIRALHTMNDPRADEFLLTFQKDIAAIEGKLANVQREMRDIRAACPFAMAP